MHTLDSYQQFSIDEHYYIELSNAVRIAVMLLPQVKIGIEGLIRSTAPTLKVNVCGSLAIGYQFLQRDGLYLCRLYFHVPLGVWRIRVRNHGFPSAVSKEFNRHNFGDIDHTFPDQE